MKKLLWIPALVLSLVLSGCGKTAPAADPRDGQASGEQSQPVPQEAGQVACEDASLTGDIHYPQLTEFPGELLLDYMNQSLARPAQSLESLETQDGKELSYEVGRCDDTWVSVLYTQTLTAADGTKSQTLTAVNLAGTTADEVTMDNAFQDPAAVLKMLDTQPGDAAVSFYLDQDGAVFFFRPEDDPSRDYVTQTIPYASLEGCWNDSLWERPAS